MNRGVELGLKIYLVEYVILELSSFFILRWYLSILPLIGIDTLKLPIIKPAKAPIDPPVTASNHSGGSNIAPLASPAPIKAPHANPIPVPNNNPFHTRSGFLILIFLISLIKYFETV